MTSPLSPGLTSSSGGKHHGTRRNLKSPKTNNINVPSHKSSQHDELSKSPPETLIAMHSAHYNNNNKDNSAFETTTSSSRIRSARCSRKHSPLRFVHDGMICSYRGGNVFDKLSEPSIFTGIHRHRFGPGGKGRMSTNVVIREGTKVERESIKEETKYEPYGLKMDEQKIMDDNVAIILLNRHLDHVANKEKTIQHEELRLREQEEHRKRLHREADEKNAREKIERKFNMKWLMLRRNSNHVVIKQQSQPLLNNTLRSPWKIGANGNLEVCDFNSNIPMQIGQFPSRGPVMPCNHYHASSVPSINYDGLYTEMTLGTDLHYSTPQVASSHKPCNIDYGVNSINPFSAASRCCPMTQTSVRCYAEVNDTARSTPVLESINMSNTMLKTMRDIENEGFSLDNGDSTWIQNFDHRSYMNPRDSSQVLQSISPPRGSKQRWEANTQMEVLSPGSGPTVDQSRLAPSGEPVVTVLHGNYIHYIHSIPLNNVQEGYSSRSTLYERLQGNSVLPEQIDDNTNDPSKSVINDVSKSLTDGGNAEAAHESNDEQQSVHSCTNQATNLNYSTVSCRSVNTPADGDITSVDSKSSQKDSNIQTQCPNPSGSIKKTRREESDNNDSLSSHSNKT